MAEQALHSNPAGIEERGYSAEITPDSDLFRLVGDQRYIVFGLSSAGILQLMYPAIGAGVGEHSDFFADPWGRVVRSLPVIIRSAAGPDADAAAQWIVRRHGGINGEDDGHGQAYDALDDETFWWAHATFSGAALYTDAKFGKQPRRRTKREAKREALYGQTVTWYERYDRSMEPVPRDYRSFLNKWNHICDNVLEMTPTAERAIDMAERRDIPRPPNIDPELWEHETLQKFVSEVVSVVSLAGLPERLRERLDIRLSKGDKAKFKAIELATKAGFRFLPEEMRYHASGLEAAAAAQ